MKKLMIALAAVAMAIGAQAAQVKWTSPVLMAAAADGSFSSTQLSKATGISNLSVTLAFFDADGNPMPDVTGTSTASLSKAGKATASTSDSFTVNADYYYTASYSYMDADGKIWTMDVDKTKFTAAAGTGAYALDVATASKWETAAVPEPTSGLLLLLGVAGLALRRRRA